MDTDETGARLDLLPRNLQKYGTIYNTLGGATELDRQAVATWLGDRPGVSNVHDLHIWALSTTRTALAAHVVWQGADADIFIDQVTDELEHDFGIGHVTLQLESLPCERAGACLTA